MLCTRHPLKGKKYWTNNCKTKHKFLMLIIHKIQTNLQININKNDIQSISMSKYGVFVTDAAALLAFTHMVLTSRQASFGLECYILYAMSIIPFLNTCLHCSHCTTCHLYSEPLTFFDLHIEIFMYVKSSSIPLIFYLIYPLEHTSGFQFSWTKSIKQWILKLKGQKKCEIYLLKTTKYCWDKLKNPK